VLLNKVILKNHKLLTMKEKEPKNAEAVIKDIRRRTKRKFSSEEKIRIVISGLRGDESINTICRKEGIAPALYYRWSKDFIEAGKRRLNGDTLREANTDEVLQIKNENVELKNLVAELMLDNRTLKKSMNGLESNSTGI
jgi:transposase